MRFDFDDELDELATLYGEYGDAELATIQGACWVISRFTGEDPAAIAEAIKSRGRPKLSPLLSRAQRQVVRELVESAPPVTVRPPTVAPTIEPDAGLGYYQLPGGEAWPIVKLGEQPKVADLSQPPAPPDPTSFAAQTEQMQADGNPLLEPIDPEDLAIIDAQIAAARGDHPPA